MACKILQNCFSMNHYECFENGAPALFPLRLDLIKKNTCTYSINGITKVLLSCILQQHKCLYVRQFWFYFKHRQHLCSEFFIQSSVPYRATKRKQKNCLLPIICTVGLSFSCFSCIFSHFFPPFCLIVCIVMNMQDLRVFTAD